MWQDGVVAINFSTKSGTHSPLSETKGQDLVQTTHLFVHKLFSIYLMIL